MLGTVFLVLGTYVVFLGWVPGQTLQSAELVDQLWDFAPFALILGLCVLLSVLVTVRYLLIQRVQQPLVALQQALRLIREEQRPHGGLPPPLVADEVGQLVMLFNQLMADASYTQRYLVDPQRGTLITANPQPYRQSFRHNPDILLLFHPENLRILEANRAAEDFYGLDHEALLALSLGDLLHPSAMGSPLKQQVAKASNGSPVLLLHRHASGAARQMDCSIGTLSNDHGDQLGFARLRDVTDQTAQLAELESQACYLQEAEEITATGHWFLGGDGQMQWSQEAYRIHGVTPENFHASLERTFRLLHPNDREPFRNALQKAMRQGEPFTLELRVRLPAGDERLIQYRGKALNGDKTSGRKGILAVFHDITEHRELEQRLREQERIHQQAARMAKLGSFVWDLNAERYRFCSAEMATIFGSSHASFIQEIDSEQALVERIHPEDQLPYMRKRDQAARERQPYEVEFRIHDADLGEWRQLLELGEVVADDNGQAQRLVGSTQDISRMKAMEDKLRQETSFRSQAAELARLGTFVWDLSEDRCFFCSGELATIYGLTSPEEYTGQFVTTALLLAQVHTEDRERYLKARQSATADGNRYQIEYRLINFLGKERYVAEIAQVLSYGGGRLRVVGSVQDISEKKRREEKLHRLATTDELTGIYNRRHFMEQGSKTFMLNKRQGQPLSVLMLDIDHFKSINTRFEHIGGDMALQAFTRCCQRVLRREDILGRLGGEEFAVLLPGVDAGRAYEMAERLRHQVRRLKVTAPAGSSEPQFSFTVSIGLASAGGKDASLDQVLLRADSALFSAKNSGRDRVHTEATVNLAGEGSE